LWLGAGLAVAVLGDTTFAEGVVKYGGTPFFPFGVWDPAGDYRGVAEHGMNCFLGHANPEDMGRNDEMFDQAEAHGLKVALYLGYDHVKHAEATQQIVRRFRDHPALLAWNIGDDMNIHSLPRVKAMAAQIRALDRDHPVAGDVAHTAETPMDAWIEFKPYLDVMLQYDYPVGLGNAPSWRSFNDHRGHLSFCESRLGPVWTYTQAFTWISTLQTVYEQCALSLPDAEQAFRDAAREVETAKRLHDSGELQEVVAARRAVNRLCRQAVARVMEHAEGTSPVPEAAQPFRGLYYGMPNFFAAMGK
jgi:hypothetical protein